MRELELDGIHDDGDHVILIDSDGDRYTLRITEALRAAVRRDRPALGALQAADTAPLRPREIQALLRAGRSADDIAEIANVPVEHVRRYEGPVLAERGWIAQRARGFHVGRGGPKLDEVVTERLRARQAGEDTAWDAWRRPDGTWTLELTFSAAERTRQAHWVVDMGAQSVTADDDEARWITDEEAPRHPYRARTRLTAITSTVYDQEAEEEGTAPRPVRPASPEATSAHPSALDEDELEALNARRGLRPVPTFDTAPVWASLDDDADGAEGEVDDVEQPGSPDADAEAEHRALAADDHLPDPEDDLDGDISEDADEQASHDESEDLQEQEEPEDAPDAEAAQDEPDHAETVDLTPLPGFDRPLRTPAGSRGEEKDEDSAAKKSPRGAKKKSARRQSMPSWDEIVFGSKND